MEVNSLKMSNSDPFNIDLDGSGLSSESPSRKELHSNRKKTFLERMQERENNQSKVKISPNAIQQRFQMKSSRKAKSSIDNLEVSPATKQFIRKEFDRERVKYNFLPEKQIELQVIHRFKTHLKSFKVSSPNNENSNSTRRMKRDKSGHCLEPGSLQICPSKQQLVQSSARLVCFHSDSDTESMENSSQNLEETELPTKPDQLSKFPNATKESPSNFRSPKRKCALIDGKPVKYVQFLTQPVYDSDEEQSKPKIRKTPVAKPIPKFSNVDKVTPHKSRVKQRTPAADSQSSFIKSLNRDQDELETETPSEKLEEDYAANRMDSSAMGVVESNVKMLFNSPDNTEFLDVCHDVELNTTPSGYSNVQITSPYQSSPLSSPRIIASNTRQILAEYYTKGTPTRFTKRCDITEGQNCKSSSLIWKESKLNSSEYSNGASILSALPLPVLEIPNNVRTLDQTGTGTLEHFLNSTDGVGLRVFQAGVGRFDVSSDMFSEGEEIDDQGQSVKVKFSKTLDENLRDTCNQKMEFSQAENELLNVTERVQTNMKGNVFNVAGDPPIVEASDILLPEARTNCSKHGVEDSSNPLKVSPEKLNDLIETSVGKIKDSKLTEERNIDGMHLMMGENSSAINTELPPTLEVGQSRVPDLNRADVKVSDVGKNDDREEMMGRLFKSCTTTRNMDTSIQHTNDPSCHELDKLSKERSPEPFSDDTCAPINKIEVNDISLDTFSGEDDDKDQFNRTLDAVQEKGDIKLNVKIVNVLDKFRSKTTTSVDIDNETVASASETATNTIEETGTEEFPLDKRMTNIEMKEEDSELQPEIPFEDSSDDLFSDIEEIENCTHCSGESASGQLSQSFLNDQKLLLDSAAGSSKEPSRGENKNATGLPFEILTPDLDSSTEGHEYATPYNSESEESPENAPHKDGFLCDLFSDAENGNNVESEEEATTDDDENYKIF